MHVVPTVTQFAERVASKVCSTDLYRNNNRNYNRQL